MPTVEDYAALAPFNIEELVQAANAILRAEDGREVQARTVRFYISKGLLFPPVGGPKYARYSLEHLRRLVAIRQWLNQGMSLEESAAMLAKGAHGGQPGLARPAFEEEEPEVFADTPTVRESRVNTYSEPPRRHRPQTPRRIQLTPFSTLVIDPRADMRAELEYLRKAIAMLPEDFL